MIATTSRFVRNFKSIFGAFSLDEDATNLPILDHLLVEKSGASTGFLVSFVLRNNSAEPATVTGAYVKPHDVIKRYTEANLIRMHEPPGDEIVVSLNDPKPGVPIDFPLELAIDARSTKEIRIEFFIYLSDMHLDEYDVTATLTLRFKAQEVTGKKFLLSKARRP
jgi:hypothetical protein